MVWCWQIVHVFRIAFVDVPGILLIRRVYALADLGVYMHLGSLLGGGSGCQRKFARITPESSADILRKHHCEIFDA